MQVIGTLAAAAVGCGGAVGFGLGVPGSAGPMLATWAVAAVALAAIALDAGRVRPPAVHRQVPRTWARAFSPTLAALLYGARLGVGPLTVLNTWLWWAATALGALAGVWWSASVGAAYGAARVAVTVVVGYRAELDMPGRMAAVRRGERAVRRATLVIGSVVAAAVLLAGCSHDEHQQSAQRRPDSTSTSTTRPPPAVDEALLPEELAPGYTRVPDAGRPGLGPLDLEAAARAEADTPAERALLATRRFRRGLARAWRSAEGDELYAAVYEFADEAGARAYLGDGLVTLEGRAAELYPVDDLPGATGFSQAERREAAAVTAHGVVVTRAARFYLVVAASARPGSSPALAAHVARRLVG